MRVAYKTIDKNSTEMPGRAGTRPVHLELLVSQLLQRMRIAVIFGGNKSADGAVIRAAGNPRSWKSYESVARDIGDALQRLGCQHVALYCDDMQLGARLRDDNIHFSWLNTGGVQGHCSVAHAASMLELLGVPYVGHDPLTAALLDNKYMFKRQLMALNIPTAPFMLWHPNTSSSNVGDDPQFRFVFADWNEGFIVKPISGRASLHVHYVDNAADIGAIAREVFDITRNGVLVEAYLPGREYCVAVTGPTIRRQERLEQLGRPFAFAAVERVLETHERVFTSMDVKQITNERLRVLDPNNDSVVIDGLQELATALYTQFPLRTLVRLDVRADRNDRLFVLEANPKPDLKAPDSKGTSLICAGLHHDQMSYDDLILSILADRISQMFNDGDGAGQRLIDVIESQ